MVTDKPVLVTGAAGFIGFHLAKKLLGQGYAVVGVDNLNDYYDVRLKKSRLALLEKESRFLFLKLDIADRFEMESVVKEHSFEIIFHLAAQAGVRYSLVNPHSYIQNNVVGFLNVLEACRHLGVKHLLYASSSSVYGANTKIPFSEEDTVDHPLSMYAATKRSNELMAQVYTALYGLPCTGLRFFTVYGPWGRPDMSLFIFTRAILEGTPLPVFNGGKLKRDFTYIDDAIEGVWRIFQKRPTFQNEMPHPVYNIGFGEPIDVLSYIETLEDCLGKKAEKKMFPMQPGEVFETVADPKAFIREYGSLPKMPLKEGLKRFVKWYREYHQI